MIPSDLIDIQQAGFDALLENQAVAATDKKIKTEGLRKDCVIVPIEFSLMMIRNNGSLTRCCIIEEISERIELHERLYRQTITDSLTGVFDRRYFDERIRQEFGRSSRYGRRFSIIIDVDGFKQANDLYGHNYGDEVLINASRVFEEILRDGDTVYRYGGDEFALILPETVKEGAVELAERIRMIFVKRFVEYNNRLKLTLSIGVASYPEDGRDEYELINVADRRMYQSKENGGNGTVAYQVNTDMNTYEGSMLRLMTDLVCLMEKNNGAMSIDGVSHSQEIRSLGVEVGRRLGLSPKRIYLFEQAAILHDIGDLCIDTSIKKKQERLTQEEQCEVRKHVIIGYQILSMLVNNDSDLGELPNVVVQHHEWVNG